MDQHYHHFSALERNVLQHQLNLGLSQAQIALALGRSRSTVSREVRRNAVAASPDTGSILNYDASFACQASFARRRRGLVRLAQGSALRMTVFKQIRLGWSPQQISGKLKLMDQPVLYNKIPLRIDVPFENKELAYWHQDDFYVQGNSSELTVWIPLQDTFAHNDALSVMSESHKNGPIAHTLKIGKKSLPEGIFDNPINIVEMMEGDCLFFSSYLIHQSNLNISNNIRYSIQLRYSSASAGKASELMGGVINV